MIQVFIVDDHVIMRQSLRMLLGYTDDLAVCGEAADAEAALDLLGEADPDVVLIDVSLPGMSGIELAQRLRERRPDLRVAMLSGHGEQSHVEQAREAGVHGYILKGNGSELPPAIRQIAGGEPYLSEALR